MSQVWQDLPYLPSDTFRGGIAYISQSITLLHGSSSHSQLSDILGVATRNARDALDGALRLSMTAQNWMSMTAQNWMRDLPEFPTNEEEKVQDFYYQSEAQAMCRVTVENSKAACRAFDELAARLTDQALVQQREIQQVEDMRDQIGQHIDSLEAERLPDSSQFPFFLFGGNLANSEQMEAKRRELEGQMRQAESKIEESMRGLQTLPKVIDTSHRFLEYFQLLLQNATRLDDVVQSTRSDNPNGASAHGELAETRWNQVYRSIEEAKDSM
ncbi:hypothetical protein B0J13DRAFT_627578 [Dactylonectria estremocensis]|uniref:Uncharacterized protein n=1 Tax=Dactylonectria estremocensis TaxID=1079267 RepID=A0A9P9IQU5_9HYPO|nr:hypothetical protein B0J13DRAFT_627578 [Dactylonectria estremocensis]